MSASPPSPARDPEKSSQRVYRGIMRDLEEGRLVPGQTLAETTLAARYGVGRNAVREAMHHLAARGVIDLSRHRSPTIRHLDNPETFEILAVCSAMTGLAAQAAACHYNPAKHTPLLAKTMNMLTEADVNDEPGSFSRARRHFYRALLLIGGNRELQRLFPAIGMHIIYAQYQSRQLRGIRLADYRHIAEAVADSNMIVAQKAAYDHVNHVREVIRRIQNDVLPVSGR